MNNALPSKRLNLTKADLIELATSGPTLGIRRSAADALYHRGAFDAANRIGDAIKKAPTVPTAENTNGT